MMTEKFRRSARSFGFAFRGIRLLYSQPNAWIQTITGLIMITAGIFLGFSMTEWMVVAICSGAVLSAEAFNTAIEKLCDHLHPGMHPEIGRIKDLSAGAVLFISAAAAACAVLILLNHYFDFF